jgi:hypothetical protein
MINLTSHFVKALLALEDFKTKQLSDSRKSTILYYMRTLAWKFKGLDCWPCYLYYRINLFPCQVINVSTSVNSILSIILCGC